MLTVLLNGEMGAGKTHFVRELLKPLGISAHSPTFTIVNQYAENIYHLDLYRIEQAGEFEHLGLEDIFARGNIVFVEWAQRLPSKYLSGLIISVDIDKIGDEERDFKIRHSFRRRNGEHK